MAKYPFTPEIMDAMPEKIAEHYRGLELALLRRICEQLASGDSLNQTSIMSVQALRSHGIDLDEIKKVIAEAAELAAEDVDKLFDDAVARNEEYAAELFDQVQTVKQTEDTVTAPSKLVSNADVEAIKKQTKDELVNITQSLGFMLNNGQTVPPGQAYQHALDSAIMQVESGAVSYNEAISNAVKELAGGGVKVVNYASGHVDSVDVAVRRATLTGVNQLNQQYREQLMDAIDTDLVETTAHRGARDKDGPLGWENHKAWQGKVYRWAKKSRGQSTGYYKDFETACGYGDVTGIGGANCRHSFYPFVEDVSERTYTDAELAALDRPPITYEGRQYTEYEATQKQRQIERAIRKQKRLLTALEAVGDKDNAAVAKIRLKRLNVMYRAFSDTAGLSTKADRLKVYKGV